MEKSFTRGGTATKFFPPVRLHKRARYIWMRVLLVLVLVLSALIGVWFLGVRPSLYHQDLMQVESGWNQATAEALQALSTVPPGPRNILISEKSINTTLNSYHTAQSSVWQVTVMPANVRVSFTGCEQKCTFTAFLEVGNSGQIHVTHTQVQGMLALIMSNDELTNALNSNLQYLFIAQITKMTVLAHAIDIQFH